MHAEQRVKDKLAEMSASLKEWGGDKLLDEDDEAAMISRCQAAGASLGWQSLFNRVQRGHLTWQRVWSEPYEVGPEAVSLVQDVRLASLQACMESINTSMDRFRELTRRR